MRKGHNREKKEKNGKKNKRKKDQEWKRLKEFEVETALEPNDEKSANKSPFTFLKPFIIRRQPTSLYQKIAKERT